MSHAHLARIALLSASASVVWAQAVPADFQDLYAELDTQLTAFDRRITSAWNGSTYPTDMGAELLTANGNRGSQLLQPNTRLGVVAELDALRALGARSIVVAVQYPLLNRTFLESVNRGSDYDGYLSFFKFVAEEARRRNMRLVVESGPVFPGVFSAGSGLDVVRHYASVTDAQYIQARAAMAGVIAAEIQPDYLQVGAEPDTEAEITGRSGLRTSSVYASFVAAAKAQVQAASVPHVKFGAGVGTWIQNGREFIDAYVRAGVDFIDLHVYPVNRNYLDNTIAYADQALAAGKEVIVAEAWLLKLRDRELGTTSPAADPGTFARDAWSFWAPLDQKFIAVFTRFCHWKQVQVFSAYWSRYLHAYLDYQTNRDKPPAQLINDASAAAAAAIIAGQSSSTGQAFRTEISAGTFALSNGSYRPNPVAPESVVIVFGRDLATSTETNSSSPLPTSLAGTTAAVVDRDSRESSASFYFAGPEQINIVLPANIPAGPAQLKVRSASGTVSNASLKIGLVGPALYSATADGRGTPLATLGRLQDGEATFEETFECDGSTCSPKPLDLTRPGEYFLAMFGTGFRGRSSLDRVVVNIGGTSITPVLAGALADNPGVDQITLPLPRSLAGRGTVPVSIVVDGSPSNALTLRFR